MNLCELFRARPGIVVNTDIDGFLSAMILQKYCGAGIVGFSNSKWDVWLTPEVRSVYNPVFVDLYVARPDVVCIEQHIIAHDVAHLRQIASWQTKVNPNIERGRTFSDSYAAKYPFGTAHFIIALLAREGIEVELPDLKSVCDSPSPVKPELGQVILRADDALYTTLAGYPKNADDWWRYLLQTSDCPALRQLVDYIKSCNRKTAKADKDEIGRFFKSLGCDGADGAFNVITNPDGSLQQRVHDFYRLLKNFTGMTSLPDLPSTLVHHRGRFLRSTMRPDSDTSILNQPNLFSYAYIYGPNAPYPNFSYTTDMP